MTTPTKEISKPAKEHDVNKLIAEYQPRLKAFIRKRVSNNEDADDILQDVFYQWLKAIENTLNPIEQLGAWLYRVARNTIINHGMKKREEELPIYPNKGIDEEIFNEFTEVLFNSEISPSPETEYLRSLVWTELENALAELPFEQRRIFELTELEAIPIKEIAQADDVPVNTLLSRKHYAVLHLRKRMRQLYEDILLWNTK